MKKIIFILLFTLTLFSLMSSINKEKINAEDIGGLTKNTQFYYDNDDPIALTNNYASYYFYNLDRNFGNNLVGSCGYVALAMLLSYYDTYWDDNIIDDRYDENEYLINDSLSDTIKSPGIGKDFPNTTEVNVASYYTFLESHVNGLNNLFHPYLIVFAENSLNYYEKNSYDYPCLMYYSEFSTLLNEYLQNNRYYSTTNFAIEQSRSNDLVDSFVIPRVKQGIPVVLYIGSLKGNHYVIAYDYNESLDELYCHFGWHETLEDGKICYFNHLRLSSTDYNSYLGAFALNFNTTHNCSNNYLDSTSDDTYCPCYFNIHPSHTHSYVSYTNFNKLKHSGLCYCGTSVFLPHIVRDGGSTCILCGGMVETGLSTFARNVLTNPMNNTIWTDSYRLSNGVIVISDQDYIKLLNNEIQIPIWEEN